MLNFTKITICCELASLQTFLHEAIFGTSTKRINQRAEANYWCDMANKQYFEITPRVLEVVHETWEQVLSSDKLLSEYPFSFEEVRKVGKISPLTFNFNIPFVQHCTASHFNVADV